MQPRCRGLIIILFICTTRFSIVAPRTTRAKNHTFVQQSNYCSWLMVSGTSASGFRKCCTRSFSQRSQVKGDIIEKKFIDQLDLHTLATAFEVLVKKNDVSASDDTGTQSSPVEEYDQMKIFFNFEDRVIDIPKYVESLCCQAETDKTCLVMAAIYCDRIHTFTSETYGRNFLLQSSNARRLLLAAVFVASKVCMAQDIEMRSISSWAQVAEVPTDELELLERVLVFGGLKAHLDVPTEEFETKVAVLCELADHKASQAAVQYLPSLDEAPLARTKSCQEAAGRSIFNDLKMSPLAAQVEDEVLLRMVSAGRVRRFIPGISVVNAGWEGHSMYMVHRGKLSVRIRGIHKRFVEEGQVPANPPFHAEDLAINRKLCPSGPQRYYFTVV